MDEHGCALRLSSLALFLVCPLLTDFALRLITSCFRCCNFLAVMDCIPSFTMGQNTPILCYIPFCHRNEKKTQYTDLVSEYVTSVYATLYIPLLYQLSNPAIVTNLFTLASRITISLSTFMQRFSWFRTPFTMDTRCKGPWLTWEVSLIQFPMSVVMNRCGVFMCSVPSDFITW